MKHRSKSWQILVVVAGLATLGAVTALGQSQGGGGTMPNSLCTPSGVSGCYYCSDDPNTDSPTGAGCAYGGSYGDFTPGSCMPALTAADCNNAVFACGTYSTCATPPQPVGTCSPISVCIDSSVPD